MSRSQKMAEALYRVLLRIYPQPFRQRLGREVREAFRDGYRNARVAAGRGGALLFTMRAVSELFWQGIEERAAARAPNPRSPRGGNVIDRFGKDVRYAVRNLRRAPAFTLVVLLTLGIAIGTTTAIFSVVKGVLLNPLPYEDADELVVYTTRFKDRGGIQLSEPEFIDLVAQTDSFEAVGAINGRMVTLSGLAQPERLRVGQFSAGVLPLLRVEPVIGRSFNVEDDTPKGDRVVLLSHGLWQQGFAGDPNVVGRDVELDGTQHTVIGVMPPGFVYPSDVTRAWIPLRLDLDDLWERNNHYLQAIGRLQAGVSIDTARSELQVLSTRLNAEYPEFYADNTFAFELETMLDRVVGDSRTPLLILFGAALFVLLVACANVANLLLSRAETRRREIAVRCALGSGRAAIVRQLLVESLSLGLLGGAAGLVLAVAGVRFLVGISPGAIPRSESIGVDAGVLVFALLISALVSVLFGLVPALQAASGQVGDVLKESGRTQAGSTRGRRTRAVLVLAEVALATMLLVGGSVMIRSFVNLRNVDPGFDYESVLTARLDLPETEFEEPVEVVDYYERVIDAVRTLPGVESVGAVARLPLARGVNNWSLQIEGKIEPNVADAPVAAIQQATPEYFEVMQLRLLSGRFFTPQDRADAAGVAIVSKSFADTYWSGENAVGKRVKVFLEEWPWLEVVGVVDNVKQYGLRVSPEPKIYFPHAQSFQTAYMSPANMHLVIRTSSNPTSLASAVRERVWEINDNVPVGIVASMEEVLSNSLAADRFVVALLSIFSAVALFLSAAGVAGLIAFSVVERTREIGIRVVLGAERSEVLRLVVVPALALTLAGVAIGILASTILTGALAGMLFEASAIDPVVYLVVAGTFIVCTLVACYLPARRASHIDPVISLRAD